MIISSAVVQAYPQNVEAVKARLEELPGVEVHGASDEGQMVVTLEHENSGDAADAFTKIQLAEGVLSANLIFNQTETEPESESESEGSLGK